MRKFWVRNLKQQHHQLILLEICKSLTIKSTQWWKNFPGELQTVTHCICAKPVEKSPWLEIWSITSNSITLRGSPYPVTIVRKLSGQERCLRPTMLATIKCERYAPIIRTIQPICAILQIKEQAKVISTLPNTTKNYLFLTKTIWDFFAASLSHFKK